MDCFPVVWDGKYTAGREPYASIFVKFFIRERRVSSKNPITKMNAMTRTLYRIEPVS